MNLPEKSEVPARANAASDEAGEDGSVADDDWGMCSKDYPYGYTILQWFSCTESLFDYLKYYMPFIGFHHGMADVELQACHEWSDTLNELFTEFSLGEISREDMVGIINGSGAMQQSYSRVRWIGKVDDLMSGGQEFEQAIREEYFGNNLSDSGPPPPIPISQKSDFVEYVADYNMRQ